MTANAVRKNMNDVQNQRPLVTFAIFGYNQEKFIKDAIAGAFSQTYQPLEILLSDDCSSDRTFEIMKKMAEGYIGPHKVKVRRNNENKGTLEHILDAVDCMSGELVILAAGDDVSVPKRTEVICSAWRKSDSWAIYSDFSEIDEDARVTAAHMSSGFINSSKNRLKLYMKGEEKPNSLVHGATSAYDRRLFSYVELTHDKYILSEDGALSLILHMLNRNVSYVPMPLVQYRKHRAALTNSSNKNLSWADLKAAEDRIANHALSQSNRCRLLLRTNERLAPSGESRIKENLVLQDMEIQRVISVWWNLSYLERISHVVTKGVHFWRWSIPRLLPKKLFLCVKLVREKLK